MKTQYQYIHFVKRGREAGKKTDVWEIHNSRSNDILGTIRWYGAWRQYCFFPEADTIFNIGCLADIDAFIREAMQERRTMRFQSFGDHEEMMGALEQNRKDALAAMKPWQAALKPGDQVLIMDPTMPVFQEVLEPDPEDGEIHPAFMLVRGFSQVCGEGEMGSACRCNAAVKLTPDEWKTFEKAGWMINEETWYLVPDLEERIKKNMEGS